MTASQTETILIVDDEEPVRRTFREWLTGSGLACTILAASDAEAALQLANQHSIDLAILDWALGAGDDGLQLLQDLGAFHPDVVAIMVTGYANQATPLDAMRMGVRDYLDKNHDLTRDTFLHAVRRQLDQIRPAKRARHLHQTLMAFREAVEKILPLVQSASALHEPVPLPAAISSLIQFLVTAVDAKKGVLLVRSYDPSRQPEEILRVYDEAGRLLDLEVAPFARSLAGSAVSIQEACVVPRLTEIGPVELQRFESGHSSVLAAPMFVAPGLHAVIELLDKTSPGATFSAEDKRLAQAAANLGTELLRQALGQRQTQQILLDAVAAALGASADLVGESQAGTTSQRQEEPPPARVLDQLRQGLSAASGMFEGDRAGAEQTLRLAEAIRVLSLKHGAPAVEHCLRLVDNVRALLDQVTTGA
jgi:two-component system, NtrC family, nitrogen regulation response regulator NtrX